MECQAENQGWDFFFFFFFLKTLLDFLNIYKLFSLTPSFKTMILPDLVEKIYICP